MAVNIGPKIGIDGEKEYRKQINDLITQAKTFSAEMRELESDFNDSGSAMDKNRRKSELLEKAIKNQEKQVEELEKGLEASREKFGENATQTQKWKQAVSNAKTELNRMRSELEKVPKPLAEIGKSMQSAGKKMKSVGDTMSKYITAPLMAVGAASVAAWKEVDDSMDIIAKKTGATGTALEGLENTAKNIATTIPTSFETAGNAVGDINTKFGVTGTELETLSGKFIKFADLNDQDVTSAVEGTQKVMAAFGVDTKDAGKLLDAMNKTGQDTGISMDSLQASMVKNAAALQDMGLDAYSAAGFLGEVETSGADTSQVMTGLSKALTNAADDGKTLPQALGEFQEMMDSTATEQEKLNAAVDLFGKKAGPAIYNACKTGSLSFESLSKDASTYLGSVETTFDSVLDPADSFTTTMNSLKLLGSEVGESLILAAAPAIETMGNKLKDAADWFASLDEKEQAFAVNTGIALAAGGPVLSSIGRLTEGAGKVVEAVSKWEGIPAMIASAVTNPVTLAVGAIGLLALAFNSLDKTSGYLNEDVQSVVTGTNEAVSALDSATTSLTTSLEESEAALGDINGKANLAGDLVDELANLESQTSLTAEQQGRMRTIVGELSSMYPELGLEIDSQTGKLNKSTDEIRKYIEQTRKMKLIEAYQKAATKGYEKLAESHLALEKAQGQQSENQEVINDLLEEQARLYGLVDDGNGNLIDSSGQFVMAANELDTALQNNANDLMFAEEKQKELTTATEATQTAYDTAKTEIADYETAATQTAAELNALTDAQQTNAAAATENVTATKANAEAFKAWAGDLLSATGTAVTGLLSAQAEWSNLYTATKESIDNQIGLFDTWEEDAEVSIDSMIEALQGQIKGMQNYATNMEKLSAAAVKSSDPNFKAVVKSIAEMGTDGAAYAQALVDAMNGDQQKFNEYLAMIGGEGSREEAQNNLAGVLTYVNNDFKTGMETGMEGAAQAFDKVFGGEKVKTGLQNFGDMILKSMQHEDTLVKKTNASAKSINTAFNGAGQNLKTTAKSSTDEAANYTTSTINGMILEPDVDKVVVPETVTGTAKAEITAGVSNVHGKVSKVTGGGTAGSAAKKDIEGKIDSLSGKVTTVSVAGGALSGIRSAISNFLQNNPVTAAIRAAVSGSTTEHADGGFTYREQLSWLSEGDQPEVVIPLSTAKRQRALELYQETGQRLGVVRPTVSTMTIPQAGERVESIKFDAGKIYAACEAGARQGMENANIKIYIGEREAGRILRGMGVAFA